MTISRRGLLVAVLHLAIVASLGGKLLVDRATRPRMWVHVLPLDPDSPLRGRYVQLRIEGRPERIAFFIPEHVPDPSVRAPGEELWAEVTLPRKGAPRPIRLAVKKNGVLTPLE
ncbi:MAG TPA: hypothetical protein VEL51_20805 [Vicinamibacterales bacterium]|nr:hypothetical protein [Vicinamibacterales bacterium]